MVGEILEELWNTELNYKGVKVNIFGIPRFKKYSKRSRQYDPEFFPVIR